MEEKVKDVHSELEKVATEHAVSNLKIRINQSNEYRDGSWNLGERITVEGLFDGSKPDAKKALVDKVEEMKKKHGLEIEPDLKPKLKGCRFPTLPNLKSIMNEDEPSRDFSIEDGVVYLFDFWATWCGPCQGPMGHNQEMLTNNADWEGKVQIVAVSIDDKIEPPRKRVTDRGWTKISHFWAAGGWKSEAASLFGIEGIPFCVLVGKDGLIKMIGHPFSMKLDENIPRLIKGEEIPGADKKDDDGEEGEKAPIKDPSYTFELCKADYEEFFAVHKETLGKVKSPSAITMFNSEFKEGKIQVTQNFIGVAYVYFTKVKEEVEKMQAALKDKFELRIPILWRTREKKIFSLKFGEKCQLCEKALGKEKQYLCTNCTPEVYFCEECIEKTGSVTTQKELAHEHGLYFLQPDCEENMEEVLLGPLTLATLEEPKKLHSSFRCDMCGVVPIPGTHFRCANCQDVDCCQKCFEIAKSPDHPDYAKIVSKAQGAGHDLKKHVVIREEFGGMLGFMEYLH